jgi:uncharacterized membrane protein
VDRAPGSCRSTGRPATGRALFSGELVDAAVAQGVVAGAATCAVGLAVGVPVMRCGTAG